MKIKEKFQSAKNWVKEHAFETKLVVGTIATAAGAFVAYKAIKSEPTIAIADSTNAVQNEEPFDYGRDLTCKFFDDETGEVLGELKCTESFMNDMLDVTIEGEL